jgi:hypothetical protein
MRFLKGIRYPHPPRGLGRGCYLVSDAARRARRNNLSRSRLRSDWESRIIKLLIWQSCLDDGPRPSQRLLAVCLASTRPTSAKLRSSPREAWKHSPAERAPRSMTWTKRDASPPNSGSRSRASSHREPGAPTRDRKSFMEPVFRIFVDDVGHHDMKSSEDPEQRYLGLTGVVMRLDYERGVFSESLNRIKLDAFGSTGVILHRREVMNRTPPFDVLKDGRLSQAFDAAILALIGEAQYKVSFGISGRGVGQLAGAHALAVTAQKEIFVVEVFNWRVEKFIQAGAQATADPSFDSDRSNKVSGSVQPLSRNAETV